MSLKKVHYIFEVVKNYFGFFLGVFVAMWGFNHFIDPPDILSCNRDQNTCFVYQKYIWNNAYEIKQQFPLNELAKIDYVLRDRGGPSCLDIYLSSLEKRLIFFCRSIPFFSYTEQDKILNAIKYSLYSSQKEFEIVDTKDWTNYVNGIFWIMIGLGILYWTILERKRIKNRKK